MGARWERFIDGLRVTPQAVVEKRILEAIDSLTAEDAEADRSRINIRVGELHPPRNWRETIREKRIQKGLKHMERDGLVARERISDAYHRAQPQNPPQS